MPRLDRDDVLVGDEAGEVTLGVELVHERLRLGDVDVVVEQLPGRNGRPCRPCAGSSKQPSVSSELA